MTENKKIYNLAKFLDEYLLEVGLLVLNGFGYTFIGILFELNKKILWSSIHSQTIGWILLIIVFILNIILGIKLISKKKGKNDLIQKYQKLSEKVQDLENTIDDLHRNNLEIFNEQLASLFYKLNLSENERISFYKYQNDKFHTVGRYSSNYKLNEKGRKYYNSNEGFISNAFQKGHFHLNEGVPEFVNGKRQEYYNIIRSKCEIPIETLKNIKIKSRSFYLYAFKDRKGLQRNSIIVFESLDTGKFNNIELIDSILKSEKPKFLSFIERIESDLPDIKNANEIGF
jgi:energy-coupling factor transporter transmembrane protein EcfT